LKKELLLESYKYELPEELIAQEPLKDRSDSRMLVLEKETGEFYEKKFSQLPDLIDDKYLIVRNNTRVRKARLFGKKDTGAKVEIFLLDRKDENTWETLARPGRRLKPGAKMIFPEDLKATILKDLGEGKKLIRFETSLSEEYIEKYGETPLPPYIKKKVDNPERYQTVYSKKINSSAAPTAGLHFNDKVIKRLTEKGIGIVDVNLGVGLGTFRPLNNENIKENQLHKEYYYIGEDTAKKYNEHREKGGKILAIGTTSVRTLETNIKKYSIIKSDEGWTNIFIYPGYKFEAVDALLTNFHLPGSSLLVMISAFAGYENVIKAYEYAVKERFRFFSFGDCMLII